MNFALNTSPHHCSWDWLLEVWQRADQIELYESAWTFDHFHSPTEDTDADNLEGWITLTALLQATERIRGGVLVSGMLYRHPAVLANMASTLDITSKGRLEVGIGVGWSEDECDAYGIYLGTMKERFGRFEEGLEVIQLLLTQERSNFVGNWYTLRDAMNNPKGVQDPLPICIGGAGLKRTIPAVAKFGHHWNYIHPNESIDDFKMRYQILIDSCNEIGRDPQEILISKKLSYSGDISKIFQEIEDYAAAGVGLGFITLSKTEPPEMVEVIAEELSKRY